MGSSASSPTVCKTHQTHQAQRPTTQKDSAAPASATPTNASSESLALSTSTSPPDPASPATLHSVDTTSTPAVQVSRRTSRGSPTVPMETLALRTGRARMNVVDLHSVCGYTTHGVPAFSNGTSNTWTNSKSYLDGVFMGYRWQCVEFARRWLWSTQRLLLPERNCAYNFACCKHVYRLKDDPLGPRRQAVDGQSAGAAVGVVRVSPGTYTTTSGAAFSSPTLVDTNAAAAAVATTTLPTATPAEILGPRKDAEAWEKVPAVFVKQGSLVPPVANSLIIYPMSWGSPWGHIGVITEVDLERGLVYVADQNRYFHDWGHRAYSAVFPLEVSRGRYYIRDHESECKGWLTFPTFVEGH